MAKLSSDGKSVTVVSGDTLWGIASTYLGDGTKYKQLAAINNIPNPDLIYVGQVVKLYADGGGGQSKPSPLVVTVNQFGLLSSSTDKLFATWTWSRDSETDSYKIVWEYTTVDGIKFTDVSSNDVDEDVPNASKQYIYTIPSNAVAVSFKVKPISKTKKENDVETTYFDATWSELKTHTVSNPLEVPPAPSIKIEDLKLTAELEYSGMPIDGIQFQIVKNNTVVQSETKTQTINKETKWVSYSCSVSTSSDYKVACRAVKGSLKSDWSAYSNTESTHPEAPADIETPSAIDETTVRLEWSKVDSATGYEIEYTTEKDYFDISNEVFSETVGKETVCIISNLTSGNEYFFRVRATNDAGESNWTKIVSVVIGEEPAAPTTWSSTTTAIVGETVYLYWVHNAEDGSSQTRAELELTINDTVISPNVVIKNSTNEDLKDKTSCCMINTNTGYLEWTEDDGDKTLNLGVVFKEGVKVQWRVRTAGIMVAYGDWSVQRTVDIYARPTLALEIRDGDDKSIAEISSFPFYVVGLPGPATQLPIGYHLTITANEMYETIDRVGNPITINNGEAVYSKYFETNYDLRVILTAGNIDLEQNVSYTATCTVTMNSGLDAEASVVFRVIWSEDRFTPTASIGIDTDTYTAYIQPYCENHTMVAHKVAYSGGKYSVTDETIDYVWGEPYRSYYTVTGERVYSGVDGDGNNVYYCQVEESEAVENITLSVYRREFDGTFTEIATGLDNSKNTVVTDPHPALDYARYRIVATSTETGAVGHYDMPGYPVGGKAVVIQWNEAWTSFEAAGEDPQSQPPWSGSLLKLPYNIDVSESHKTDVSLVEYIGRSRPVSYYGTHLGETATWNIEIAKNDKETIYALRRLAIWMGDVYVREPSGSGYWANISVSFNQKHRNVTIPVTLNITRVEGGI